MDEKLKSKPRASQQTAAPTIDAWCILEILIERWQWPVLCGLLLAGLAFLAGTFAFTKTYMATAQLMRNEPVTPFDFLKPPVLSQDTFSSLLKSPELLQQVSTNAVPPVSTEVLNKSVFIKTDSDSDVVKVGVKGLNAQWAIDIANLYAHQAVAFRLDMEKQEAEKVVRAYLHDRLAQMDKDAADLEKQFRALPQSGAISARLNQISGVVTNMNQQIQSSTQSPMLTARLSEQLNAALADLGSLTRKYTDEHPEVQRQRSLVKSLQTEISHYTNAAGMPVSGPFGVQHDGSISAQLFNPDYEIIRSKLQALETSRQVVSDRLQEALAFMASPPGDVSFFAPATMKNITPGKKWLKVALVTVFGGLLGIAFAVGAALFVEFFDTRLKSAADVERVTKLPVIATLANLEEKGPSARELWAFRAWTMLQGRLSPSPNHGLVCGITSSRKGEGRSTWINLLADAATRSGFRVLTIATRPPNGNALPTPEVVNGHAKEAEEADKALKALTTNALACPSEVTDQFNGPNARPQVHIPLPGWVWNLDRRKQWQDALDHWRAVDNLVILVELPPAHVPEAVLLGENLPNLVWLTASGQADASETRMQLETLRHARCNLVGAVLNREPATPLKNRFPRWMGCVAFALALSLTSAHAQDTNRGPIFAPISAANTATNRVTDTTPASVPETSTNEVLPTVASVDTTNLSFSITSPSQRTDWLKHLTLGPGDVLNITLYGQPELTRSDILVGPDGKISFLEAQDVPAAGFTVDELRTNLDQELGKYRRAPRSIVTPFAYRSKKYFMLGRVAQSGVYVLDRPLTVLEAVARAHGLQTGMSGRNNLDLADFQRSFLMRGGKRIPLDFERLFERGDLSQNIPIEPDDYLYFPPANAREVYVVGEVRIPGVVPYTPDLTVIGALSQRGGFSDLAYKSHVMVLRGSWSKPKLYVVDTFTVLDARGQDFKLEPRDIIYVSGRPFLHGEELLDLALSAFLQSMTAEWAGRHIGPIISRGIIPGP